MNPDDLSIEEFSNSRYMRDGWVYVDGNDAEGRSIVVSGGPSVFISLAAAAAAVVGDGPIVVISLGAAAAARHSAAAEVVVVVLVAVMQRDAPSW
jgi:hypothetical protein